MSRALAGILAGCLVLAIATVAGAGIPDADNSYVTMDDGGLGLSSCPTGNDMAAYGDITVTALNGAGDPISGIPSGNIFFTFGGSGGDNVSHTALASETDVNGEITFEVEADGYIPWGSLTVTVQIYTVAINDSDVLYTNTVDYNNDGIVDPVDFGQFSSDFGGTSTRSDFNWDGVVDPVDFGSFSSHFGHN